MQRSGTDLVKRSITTILLSIIASILAWVILGGLLGLAGMALTSFIPFVGLGVFLALFGALLHSVLIILNIRPVWWKVGVGFAIVLSSLSIMLGTLSGNRFPISFMLFFVGYYFLFSSLFYCLIQKYIVELFR